MAEGLANRHGHYFRDSGSVYDTICPFSVAFDEKSSASVGVNERIDLKRLAPDWSASPAVIPVTGKQHETLLQKNGSLFVERKAGVRPGSYFMRKNKRQGLQGTPSL